MPRDPADLRARRTIAASRLALNEAVFDWCLRSARRELARQALEPALAWSLLAARSAVHHGFGWLASAALEETLLAAAARLPVPEDPAPWSGPTRWLHVMDQAYAIGGHTALVERWTGLDRQGDRHRVLLLSHRGAIHQRLVDTMQAAGGDVTALDPGASLVDRALRLRQEARRHADRVVLHIHPWSVLPVVALGVAGGPPVMLLNHLSQKFWVGGSVADLVVSLRDSALEWSRAHRGITRNALLPIPVPRSRETETQAAARRTLGLPADAIVLLTIGHAYKYRPLPGLDFLEAAAAILRARPRAHLLAVGPHDDAPWRALREASGQRARATGPRHDLALFHAAADIYLEGFPVGSPTALLEAGLRGLPCVRAPVDVSPPFATDGIALGGLEQPPDVAGYVSAVLALVDDRERRAAEGAALAGVIETYHGTDGWARHLTAAERALPARHRLHPPDGVAPLPGPIRDFSVTLSTRHHTDDTLTFTLRAALEQGLRPRLDAPLVRTLAGRCLARDPRMLLRRPLLAALAGSLAGPALADRLRRARRRLVPVPRSDGQA
jgi:glycosyltransferase involved in cell wall biosynthesis